MSIDWWRPTFALQAPHAPFIRSQVDGAGATCTDPLYLRF